MREGRSLGRSMSESEVEVCLEVDHFVAAALFQQDTDGKDRQVQKVRQTDRASIGWQRPWKSVRSVDLGQVPRLEPFLASLVFVVEKEASRGRRCRL